MTDTPHFPTTSGGPDFSMTCAADGEPWPCLDAPSDVPDATDTTDPTPPAVDDSPDAPNPDDPARDALGQYATAENALQPPDAAAVAPDAIAAPADPATVAPDDVSGQGE